MDFGRSKKKVASRALGTSAAGRLRIRWGRTEPTRLLSHLDNMKVIETALRKANTPVAFTQGTHPRMKLSFCPPLPMGFTSETEFVDVTLEQLCTSQMIDSIRKALPDGFELLEAKTVFAKTASLSESINRVIYVLKLESETNTAQLKKQAEHLLNRDKLEILRKTKSGESMVDIRPAIFKIEIESNELILTLGIGTGGYARPTEVAQLLFVFDEAKVATLPFHRREMFRVTEDERRIEGIEL